ncbi:MAG TPA: globin domain-containing protein [Allosphingosinicella sp.]|nr:globin domain-containing protein [Allosphingosinicella sp.]
MAPDQIRIVRRGFQSIAGKSDRAAALFFAHLFEIDPSLRRLFPGDLARRGAKLVHAVGLIVEDLHRVYVFVPALEALAVRLAGHGLDPSDYARFGEALKRTARSLLGDRFTPDMEAALDRIYAELSGVMVGTTSREFRLAA